MAKIVGLPKLSPTMEEGTLAKWSKKEGDAIAIDDLVAEIETDKATMEWRAFDPGVLLKILAPEGSTLKPDQPVAIIGARASEDAATAASATGGVMKDTMPQYITNMCTASGFRPTSTRLGASSTARKM